MTSRSSSPCPTSSRTSWSELVGQTAVLRFRAVYAAEQVQPPEPTPSATAEPSSGATAPAQREPSAGNSERPRRRHPSPVRSPATTRRCPRCRPPRRGRWTRPAWPADGQGTPPDQAMDWQPTEACQAAFAEFTCETKVTDVADQALFACNQEKTEKYLLGPTLIEGNQLTTASRAFRRTMSTGWSTWSSTPRVSRVREGHPAPSQPRASRRTASPSCWTASRSPRRRSARPSRAAGPRSRATSTRRARPSWPTCLKYGALPLAFEVSEVNNVSATLGGEQLRAGIIAGIIGLALVVGYCFLYYRGLGIVVVASLAIAGLITYACMVLLGSSRRLRAQPARHRRRDRGHRHHRGQLRHLLRTDP